MSIRKTGLWIVLSVGWLAGHASASVFTLDSYHAMLLRRVGVSPGDVGSLLWVGNNPDPFLYSAMQGAVGYLGSLFDSDNDLDSWASMKIGAAGTPALGDIQGAGSYTGFELFVANDDDDPWAVQLYVEAGGASYSSGFTSLTSGANSTLMLGFGTVVDFTQVTDIGFEIQGHFVPYSKPSNPDAFHISAAAPIPAPGAGLLSLLGVAILGWVRRSRHM